MCNRYYNFFRASNYGGGMRYRCLCGCINEKSEMFLVRKLSTGRYTQRLRCSKHRKTPEGDIKSRTTICKTCGCEIEFAGRGGMVPENCKVCLRPHRLKKMREYAQTRISNQSRKPNKYNNGHLKDLSRWDCAGRVKECLIKYDKYQCTPCLGCKNYTPRTLNIEDYLRSNGNSIRSFKYQSSESF